MDAGLNYTRISQVFRETDDSLENQLNHNKAAAGVLGVPIADEDRHTERDSGHETADTRKVLLRVRAKVRSRKYTHLFIHNFDRLSRTPEELVMLWKECLAHGVKMVVAMWPQFHSM